MKRDTHITGNVGLYYVCYRLSRLGWNAMPTARNARGIDVVAYAPDGSRFVGIQVKALSKRNPVPLGTDLGKVIGDFWVIVNQVHSDAPVAFVMLPGEVRDGAAQDGTGAWWLEPSAYDRDEFREAWGRIELPSGA